MTKRLLAVFRERGYSTDHHIFIVPQQSYLYVETKEKPFGSRQPVPPVATSSTTHKPLGRLKYLGDAVEWEYQPYLWTDEFWDDRDVERGAPEDLMLGMLLKLG